MLLCRSGLIAGLLLLASGGVAKKTTLEFRDAGGSCLIQKENDALTTSCSLALGGRDLLGEIDAIKADIAGMKANITKLQQAPTPAPTPASPDGSAGNAATSCNALQGKSSGLYYIKDEHGVATKVYCDMATDGGGWTLVANTRDTSNNCKSSAVGSLTSKNQGSSWRLSDSTIRYLQGSGDGKFRYEETGYRSCTGRGSCTGKVFWKYTGSVGSATHDFYSDIDRQHGRSRGSKGHGHHNLGNIHFCSSSLDGPYYGSTSESCFNNGHNGGRCGYSSHYGLDTYGTGNIHNGKCGMYFIWCYGDQLYRDGGSSSNGGLLWLRED